MPENNYEDMKDATEELEKNLVAFIHKTKLFTQELQHELDALRKLGLARETVQTYQKKHLEGLKHRLEGIAEYLEKDALSYTKRVYLDIVKNIRTSRGIQGIEGKKSFPGGTVYPNAGGSHVTTGGTSGTHITTEIGRLRQKGQLGIHVPIGDDGSVDVPEPYYRPEDN